MATIHQIIDRIAADLASDTFVGALVLLHQHADFPRTLVIGSTSITTGLELATKYGIKLIVLPFRFGLEGRGWALIGDRFMVWGGEVNDP